MSDRNFQWYKVSGHFIFFNLLSVSHGNFLEGSQNNNKLSDGALAPSVASAILKSSNGGMADAENHVKSDTNKQYQYPPPPPPKKKKQKQKKPEKIQTKQKTKPRNLHKTAFKENFDSFGMKMSKFRFKMDVKRWPGIILCEIYLYYHDFMADGKNKTGAIRELSWNRYGSMFYGCVVLRKQNVQVIFYMFMDYFLSAFFFTACDKPLIESTRSADTFKQTRKRLGCRQVLNLEISSCPTSPSIGRG